MDPRLKRACFKGDVTALVNLFHENNNILSQTTLLSNTTALHLALRFGRLELVKKIIELKPSLVLAENVDMETPVFEACREGHDGIVKLLLEEDFPVAFGLNKDKDSVLFVACSHGHLKVVRVLLSKPDVHRERTNYLHVAASNGYTDNKASSEQK
ncbi:uncharacterized protein LOC143846046 [Tasmannia lanceolata]|uniref:uncharacterized protein LOC143846046 n=1 Tax=Tasmannia lanceolata TaxID=3420 RepID=UPI004062A624